MRAPNKKGTGPAPVPLRAALWRVSAARARDRRRHALEKPAGLGAEDLNRAFVVDRQVAAREILGAGTAGGFCDAAAVQLDLGGTEVPIPFWSRPPPNA